MPDKKLTDNEIIKALEWNVSKYPTAGFVHWDTDEPKLINTQYVLDLINRQKAEIERLKDVKEHIVTLIHRDCDYTTEKAYNEAFQKALEHLYDNVNAKAEAYKEFAERLKEKAFRFNNVVADSCVHYTPSEYYYVLADDIVDLLKELVGC